MVRFLQALAVALLTALAAPQVGAQHGYSTGDVEHFAPQSQGSGGGSTGSLPIVGHTDDIYETVNGCVVVTRHGRVVAVMPPQHPMLSTITADPPGDPVGSAPDTYTVSWTSHGRNNEFPVARKFTVTTYRRAMEDNDTFRSRFTAEVRQGLIDWPDSGDPVP